MGVFEVRTTERACVVDITDRVLAEVAASGVTSGLCLIGTRHTTVGVTINEPDSTLFRDLLRRLENMVPRRDGYLHPDNSDSHIKAMLIGGSVAAPVTGGGLDLGTWQAVLLCEFDGPRRRTVRVDVTGG